VKRRFVHLAQKYLLNPPIKVALAFGAAPPGYALLETVGRKSGKPRRTPVGNGLEGDTFWIVTEHGRRAGYVLNIEANPRVRVKLRRGLRYVWLEGAARVLCDDDPRERQRRLSRGHPLRAINALAVRTLGTELLTVRIDLGPATENPADD
jgi:deazaflavin-dependent oxidoreductase (nitroreductase family)